MAAPLVKAAKVFFSTFAADAESLLKIILLCMMLPLCFFTLFFSFFPASQQTVPNISISLMNDYKRVCNEKAQDVANDIISQGDGDQNNFSNIKEQYCVNYRYIIAIDAVRYKQDFSKVSIFSIKDLVDRFYIVTQEERTEYVETIKYGKTIVEEHTYYVNVYTLKDYKTVVNELVQEGLLEDNLKVDNFLLFDYEKYLPNKE